jgi:cytochrome d ubiquinol oxidase subunit I
MGIVTGIVQEFQFGMNWSNSYVPVLWVTYWSFRIMVGLGLLMLIVSAWSLWRSRRGGKPFELGRWTLWVLVASVAAPFLANTTGRLARFLMASRKPVPLPDL